MKQTLILLAGYPATGKTYLCNQILKRFPAFIQVSQDSIKEKIWEQHGFNNEEEKMQLEAQSWEKYYCLLEQCMVDGGSVISDYPFSDKQKSRLHVLSQKYQVQVVTIRLTGDLEVLFKRAMARDLDPKRPITHLVSRYKKGDVLKDRAQADSLLTHEIFMDRCKNRGYDRFSLGYLIEVDATDYKKIDYEQILSELQTQLKVG